MINIIMHCIALQIANIVHVIPGPIVLTKGFANKVSTNAVDCRKNPSAALVEAP